MNDPKLIAQSQLAPIIHQVGMSPAFIGCNMFCANCWPKQVPSFIVWGGFSLCHQCATVHRQSIDQHGSDYDHARPIVPRDYKTTWGKDPEAE